MIAPSLSPACCKPPTWCAASPAAAKPTRMDVETCLNSLIKIDAASSDDVYGGVLRLRTGLQLLSSSSATRETWN